MQTNNKKRSTSKIQIINTLVLIVIATILFSILWTLNKGLRQFIYHEFRHDLLFYGFGWKLDNIEEIALNDDKYLFECNKSIYVFNKKVFDKKNKGIYINGQSIQDICIEEKIKNKAEYLYPYTHYSIVGLFGEIFQSQEQPTIEKGWLLERLKVIDPVKYNAYWEKVNRLEKTHNYFDCLKTGSSDYCKKLLDY